MSVRTIITYQATTVTNEFQLGEAALPGHVVTLESDGKFYKQATAGAPASMQVLREDDLQGKGVTDAYASDDRARAAVLRAGDRFHARLAGDITVEVGALLKLAGGGRFTNVGDSGTALVRSREAITSNTSADDFVLVEVL